MVKMYSLNYNEKYVKLGKIHYDLIFTNGQPLFKNNYLFMKESALSVSIIVIIVICQERRLPTSHIVCLSLYLVHINNVKNKLYDFIH